ncbi:MAG: DUF2508 family protein [Bacillota bacterium]|jgi:hypothetical protein|nr:DUF2508 family protein [Bacillota bacterium]NLU54305.1 DUF2508 family protein [Bacillota bacterium]HOA92074.1 DUF2508 family protein [Bacillota bacterium]HOJ46425.1 DUF2508 family protein [Bacillota bacterium]HOL13621.1 DUF2508 family protein [Bacillota bacterium]
MKNSSLETYSLKAAIKDALTEWSTAKNFFDQVTEPDLVDYAVLRLEAAEKRVAFLLKKAREEGEPP